MASNVLVKPNARGLLLFPFLLVVISFNIYYVKSKRADQLNDRLFFLIPDFGSRPPSVNGRTVNSLSLCYYFKFK